jgi:hypothetical protein
LYLPAIKSSILRNGTETGHRPLIKNKDELPRTFKVGNQAHLGILRPLIGPALSQKHEADAIAEQWNNPEFYR